jgi:hypothetical protein
MLDVTSQKTEQAIDEAVASFRAMLEKHRPEFPYQAFLRAIDSPEFAKEQFGVLRRRVEAESEVIVRPFKVDRTKTPRQLLDACKRVLWHIDDEVLKSMPMDGPEEGELVFFPLRRDTLAAEIKKVLDDRSLVPDYAAQMQVNADDSEFADEHPNGEVSVYGRGILWSGTFWFAGRRKT